MFRFHGESVALLFIFLFLFLVVFLILLRKVRSYGRRWAAPYREGNLEGLQAKTAEFACTYGFTGLHDFLLAKPGAGVRTLIAIVAAVSCAGVPLVILFWIRAWFEGQHVRNMPPAAFHHYARL